jgi:hypothetical protein
MSITAAVDEMLTTLPEWRAIIPAERTIVARVRAEGTLSINRFLSMHLGLA